PLEAVEGILGFFDPALPVREEDFVSRGLRFDLNRLAKPYITRKLLEETFGPEADEAAARFLAPTEAGTFLLKEAFNTQRKVERFFESQPESETNSKLKIGLFDLISD